MEKKSETRARIEGVGKLRCRTNWRGRGREMRRKVMTNGILNGDALSEELGIDSRTVEKMMRGIRRILRAGWEVRLDIDGENAIRLYPCLETDFSTMFVAASTMGGFRESVRDLAFTLVKGGEELEPEEAFERSESRKEADRRENTESHVTPDTMVTCPKCGAKFRVGKKLG